MRSNVIKDTSRRCIHFSGINRLARGITSSYPRIVTFHNIYSRGDKISLGITTDSFRSMLEYIKKHYSAMKVHELINLKKRNGIYPKKAVAITFDDGFKSFYYLAWPLLRALNIPSTIFVLPDLIEKDPRMFWDRFSFGTSMPNEIPKTYELMSWDMLKELSNSELIEIGSHTLTHAILANEDSQRSWNEISMSHYIIEAKLKVSVQSFSYPNGKPGDYRLDQMEMVREADYCCGVATHFGYVTPRSNIMALPRIGGEHNDIYSFYKYLDGVEHFLRRISGVHCELCLEKDFEHRIEHCKKRPCFNWV
jgi:peptidoglycan/xylan/chitin deacetylase (PgdA/CDA1 family)